MKKIISFLLSILTLISMMLYNLPASAICMENPYSQFIDDPYYQVTHDHINGIVSNLSKLPSSGSVCIDYLGEEILLHRAILFATHNIESYSSNPELIDIVDDITDNYTGELKEMRIELAKLIDNSKKNNSSKFDDSYYKEFNPIANKLSTDFSKISSKDSNDLTYIKEVLILLQASHDIADIDSICTNNDLVSKISKNSLTNTSGYISRLTTLKNSIK